MKFISDDEASRRITPRKNRCVWMEAGVLSYLLCDREFDCDNCPLDEAMRSHFSDIRKAQGSEQHEAACQVAGFGTEDFRYTRNHCWIEPRSDGSYRVGFEPGLSQVLASLKSLVLPAPGQRISPKMYSAWVIMEGGTLPLKLPLKGKVERVNPLLADQPHLVCLSPTGDGWLFEMEVDNHREFVALPSAGQIHPKYDADQQAFRRLAGAGLGQHNPLVGSTLQDGGRPMDDLASLIGPVRYFSIVKRVFMTVR